MANPADTEAIALFAKWCRLNPTFDDPELLASIFDAYRKASRRRARETAAA